MWKIPLSDVSFDEEEERAVLEVLRSRWLTMGEVTARFEHAFADFIGVKHAVAVTNCTAALQLAYRAIGIRPGDEVVMPSLTFVATANSAVACGGVPVFADVVSEDDLTISPMDIESKLTQRTKAIAVVHYAGYPCDMDSICDLARQRGLAVIEDCAHSPGARYRKRSTGALGDVGCFSFFSNKNMTTGEGGMITTDRDDIADRVRLLRSHGMTSLTMDRHKGHSFTYDVLDAGTNARIDEMRSALGLVQLSKLKATNARRELVSTWYRSALTGTAKILVPFRMRRESSFHIQPVVLEDGVDRGSFMARMKAVGIQTSIHYPLIHRFSFYAKRASRPTRVPVTEALADRLVTLPLYPAMSEQDVNFVAERAKAATQ